MSGRLLYLRLAVLMPALTILFGLACSGQNLQDPKQVVIAFFGAMEKNDQASLAHLLDLAALMKNVEQDYAFQGSEPRVFTNPQQILEDLTNDGQTKQRWFSLQRIVNRAEIMGETATVEVTFVDKAASKGYRTRFGLRKTNGNWKIYSFRTVQDTP